MSERQQTALDYLKSFRYSSLEEAEAALDSREHEFFPCENGHFDCAKTEGGRCLGGVYAAVCELREIEDAS